MKFTLIPWPVHCLPFACRKRLVVCGLGGVMLSFGMVLPMAVHGETGSGAVKIGQPVSDGVSFFSRKTRLWKGRSQIVYFQVGQPAPQDRFYSFQIDEKTVHLLVPPQILKGEKIGFLRVLSLAEGKSQIAIDGVKLDVEIVPDTATSTIAELNPQIVAPASGANVWGEFSVGVEQLTLGDPALLPMPTLRLVGGKEIAGRIVPDQKPGPHARWVFNVNADDLAPGPSKLVAVQKDQAGHEIQTNAIYVNVIRPQGEELLAGLCKDANSGDRPSNDSPTAPKVINDDKYGQGMIVDNGNDGQPWCLPVWIEKKGDYQVMVTARGDIAGDALPTLALMIDEVNQPETSGRLATSEWQRIPVGHPITLEEGGHIISVRTRNSFNHGPEDVRNVYLQKYEFVRVDHPAVQVATNNGGVIGGAAPMMSMMSMAATAHSGKARPDEVHVAFTNNLDGQMVTGAIDVAAKCWWPDRDHSPPPRVELYVNRKLVSTQISGQPRFLVDPSAFAMGSNVLELRAVLSSGIAATSVPMSVEVPRDFPLPKHAFRPTVNFTTFDSGLCTSITPPEPQSDPEIATFASNGESTIKIPDDLAGKYKIVVEARGDAFQGPPLMSVSVKNDGKETKFADVPVGPAMGTVSAGQADLTTGTKELKIGFINDAYEAGKGDRNLFIKAVHLMPIDETPDAVPPLVSIVLAPKSIGLGSVDAVVARVMDNQRVAATDLLIDNQPQHLDQRPLHGLGPMVLPLLTRELKPGRHTLKVVAHDDAGNQGTSTEMAFTVSASATTVLSKYERALFLLNRFGYGPEPQEVAAILTMGEKNWLESRLAQDLGSPSEANEQEAIKAQFPDRHDGNQVTRGAMEYLLTEPNPVRARFVMWAENHFSTWLNKDTPSAKESEHESFVKLGPVPFFDLLFNSATSPAMLVYLDQRNSFSKRLNENYAREIMELHTLGVKAGYTQKDVTTLADLLTGWTLADEAPGDGAGGDLDRFFGYDPHLNSGTACKVFGVEFPGVEPEKRFDRVLMALEFLSAHPACATFISRKLCEQYVSDPAPPKLVADLAQVYLETGGDLPAMLVTMSQHPDFWASPGKVANPIDFGVRTARMARSANPGPVNDLIFASGMGMFDRATPDGYPEDNGYSANSNGLLQRWRFAKSVQNDFLAGGLIPSSWRPADTAWNPDVTQRIVDLAAVRMTGNVLSAASNDAAQKLITDAPPNTDIRLHALATFICQLPENSLK